jgi:SOS response regulatory protein OraA/RecX
LKRATRLKGQEWNEFRKKLSEFLARRGFSYSVIAPIVSKIWNEISADTQNQDYEDEDIA